MATTASKAASANSACAHQLRHQGGGTLKAICCSRAALPAASRARMRST